MLFVLIALIAFPFRPRRQSAIAIVPNQTFYVI
jgi:hypothetical protein